MTLLNPGYWPDTYWPADYWQTGNPYWPEAGAAVDTRGIAIISDAAVGTAVLSDVAVGTATLSDARVGSATIDDEAQND